MGETKKGKCSFIKNLLLSKPQDKNGIPPPPPYNPAQYGTNNAYASINYMPYPTHGGMYCHNNSPSPSYPGSSNELHFSNFQLVSGSLDLKGRTAKDLEGIGNFVSNVMGYGSSDIPRPPDPDSEEDTKDKKKKSDVPLPPPPPPPDDKEKKCTKCDIKADEKPSTNPVRWKKRSDRKAMCWSCVYDDYKEAAAATVWMKDFED